MSRGHLEAVLPAWPTPPPCNRTCWQRAPSSSPLHSPRHVQQAPVVHSHPKVFASWFTGLENRLPCLSIWRFLKPKCSYENSLCCQFGFCAHFAEPVLALQSSGFTASLTQPAGWVPGSSACHCLQGEGSMWNSASWLQSQLTRSCEGGKALTWVFVLCAANTAHATQGEQKLEPLVLSYVDDLQQCLPDKQKNSSHLSTAEAKNHKTTSQRLGKNWP